MFGATVPAPKGKFQSTVVDDLGVRPSLALDFARSRACQFKRMRGSRLAVCSKAFDPAPGVRMWRKLQSTGKPRCPEAAGAACVSCANNAVQPAHARINANSTYLF